MCAYNSFAICFQRKQYFVFGDERGKRTNADYNYRLVLQYVKMAIDACTVGIRLIDDKYHGFAITLSRTSGNGAVLVGKALELRPVEHNKELPPVLTVRREKIVSNVCVQVPPPVEPGDVVNQESFAASLDNVKEEIKQEIHYTSPSPICPKHFPIRKRISVLGDNYFYYKPQVVSSPFTQFLVVHPNKNRQILLVTTDGKYFNEYNYDELFGLNTGTFEKYLGGWYDTEQDKFFLLNTTSEVVLISTRDFKAFTFEDSTNFQNLLEVEIFDSFYQSRYTGGCVLLGTADGAYKQNSDGTFTKLFNGFCRITGSCFNPRYFVRTFNGVLSARKYIGALSNSTPIKMTLDDGQQWFDKIYGHPITSWTSNLVYKRFWITTDEKLFAYAENPNDYQAWFGPVRQSESDTGLMGFVGVGNAQNKNTGYHVNGVFKDTGISWDYNQQLLRIWGSNEQYTDVVYASKTKIFGTNTALFPDIWETNSNGIGFSPYDYYIYF